MIRILFQKLRKGGVKVVGILRVEKKEGKGTRKKEQLEEPRKMGRMQ